MKRGVVQNSISQRRAFQFSLLSFSTNILQFSSCFSKSSLFINGNAKLRRISSKNTKQVKEFDKESEIIISPLPDFATAPDYLKRFIQIIVILGSKVILAFQKTQFFNKEVFLQTLYSKERKRPLITASNHASTVDDPVLWGATIPLKLILKNEIRWTLGAKEIMFKNVVDSWIFGNGNVIPVVRGAGLNQEGVQISIEKLKQGKWIHIFPEGKVNQSGTLLKPIRWGIGKLVESGSNEFGSPLVLPFYHLGIFFLF